MARPSELSAPGASGLRVKLRAKSRARREDLAAIQTAEAGLRRNGDPVPELQIEMIAICDLRPSARRVRKSDPAQVARVRASILRFGMVTPVLIDGASGIVHGHVVVDAARSLDLTKIPCVRLEHLSAEEVRLLSITLNRLAETGEWDFEALTVEFRDLVILDEPMTITGFDAPVLDALLTDDAQDVDPTPDRIPALGREPVSLRGDVWELGGHRLSCGDARDEQLLASLLGGEPARLAFVDPPYNVRIQNNVTTQAHREFEMASGEMSGDEFVAFLTEAFRTLAGALTPAGIVLSFMDWRGYYAMTTAARALGLEELNLLVWAKTNAGMGSLWRSQHELIGAYKKPGGAHINNVELGKSGRWRSNVWRYPGASSLGSQARGGLADHPTPKPVAMLVDGILDVTNRGDTVIDTFSGSGSTLIACDRTGRRFVGTELDALYVDLAVRRWEAETGRDAILQGSELTFAHVAAERQEIRPQSEAVEPPSPRPRYRVPAGSSNGRA